MAESLSIATVVSAMLRCDLVSILFGDFDLMGHPYINTFLKFLIFYIHSKDWRFEFWVIDLYACQRTFDELSVIVIPT